MQYIAAARAAISKAHGNRPETRGPRREARHLLVSQIKNRGTTANPRSALAFLSKFPISA